jgi:hypothetical protein
VWTGKSLLAIFHVIASSTFFFLQTDAIFVHAHSPTAVFFADVAIEATPLAVP